MSLLTTINAASVEGGVYDYYFAVKSESAKNWSKFKATSSVGMSGYGISDIGGLGLDNAGITGVSLLDIDGQILTADETDLLLNGQPIATITGITGIDKWSLYPSISSLHMNAVGITGEPFGVSGSAYYGYYQGSTLGITGTYGNSTLLLDGQAIGGTGFTGSAKYWSQNVAISSINGGGQNISNVLGIHSNTLMADTSITSPNATFTNATITNATITNLNVSGITGITGVSSWSKYPATSTINTAGNNISGGTGNGQNILADRDINITSATGNITISPGVSGVYNQTLSSTAGQINLTADQGALFTNYSDFNITAQNGNRGRVNITANAGLDGSLPTPGEVHILANGGSFKSATVGGLVTIDATTPSIGPAATSAIKMSASGINSYAGYRGSIGSLAGYNYVYGSLGVNISASVVPPGINTPLTCYLYGDNGVVCGSNLYVYQAIYPYYNGSTPPLNLTLSGRTVGGIDYGVYMEIAGAINFSSSLTGKINGCKVFAGNNTAMSGITSITSGSVSTDTLQSSTGSLAISQVGSITGNSGSTISGFTGANVDTITTSQINGNAGAGLTGFTNVSSTNGYFNNISGVTAFTGNACGLTGIASINGEVIEDILYPSRINYGTFGAATLTAGAPTLIHTTPNFRWKFGNIDTLLCTFNFAASVDTAGTYGLAFVIVTGTGNHFFQTYNFSTGTFFFNYAFPVSSSFSLSSSFVDSFPNTIADGTAFYVQVYLFSTVNANLSTGKTSFSLGSGQALVGI